MRIRLLTTLAAAFAFGGAAGAQPAKSEPTVEIRVRSVNDLLGKAEYIGKLAGQEEAVRQLVAIVKQLGEDGKGIEGIDPAKPFGAHATLTADVINSTFVVMVPVADQDRFLGLIKDRLLLAPEKADDGTYKIAVPVIEEIRIRFADGYAYVARSVADLDPKKLVTQKAFFAKDDGAVGSIVVRIDQIPAELKTFVIGQLELGITEQRKKTADTESPAEKAAMDWTADNVTGAIKTFLEDAKELRARVTIDEKTDDLSAELTLTARSGTTLSKNIASLSGKTSLPAAIVGGKDAAVRVTAKAGLPDGTRKDLDKIVDTAIAESLKQIPEGEREVAERVMKAIAPTLKGGELDLGLSLTPRDSGYTLVAALGVKKGKDVETLVKDLAKEFGPMIGDAIEFDFDVEKIGGFNLHKVTVNVWPPEAEKVFGTNKLWVATSEDYLAVSVEPEGKALRDGLKAKAVAVPVVSVEVATAKLAPLVAQNFSEEEIKGMLKDVFGEASPAGRDTLSITVTGGDKLTVKGNVKGKAVGLVLGYWLKAIPGK